ncbi:MAG: hypothetical protein ABR606_02710 [Vicinamibacterales bacterium]
MARRLVKGHRKAQPAKGDPMDGAHPMDDRRQCTAANRQGARCQRAPILGGTVCHYHGGAAPQVQKAAALRMAELVDPAIMRLAELMMQTEFPSTAYQAVRDVLDRNGLAPEQKFKHSGTIGRGDPTEDFQAMLAEFEMLLIKAKTPDTNEDDGAD